MYLYDMWRPMYTCYIQAMIYKKGARMCNQLSYEKISIISANNALISYNKETNMSSKKDYRIIIAGSRSFNDYSKLKSFCDDLLKDLKKKYNIIIISGNARGVDKLGERYARESKYGLEVYPAQWDLYGKSAGYRRNTEMSEIADALIAVWDKKSSGTKHMIKTMENKKRPIGILFFNVE